MGCFCYSVKLSASNNSDSSEKPIACTNELQGEAAPEGQDKETWSSLVNNLVYYDAHVTGSGDEEGFIDLQSASRELEDGEQATADELVRLNLEDPGDP